MPLVLEFTFVINYLYNFHRYSQITCSTNLHNTPNFFSNRVKNKTQFLLVLRTPSCGTYHYQISLCQRQFNRLIMTCLNERRALLISGLKLELSVVSELSYVEALKTGNAGKGEREIRKSCFSPTLPAPSSHFYLHLLQEASSAAGASFLISVFRSCPVSLVKKVEVKYISILSGVKNIVEFTCLYIFSLFPFSYFRP